MILLLLVVAYFVAPWLCAIAIVAYLVAIIPPFRPPAMWVARTSTSVLIRLVRVPPRKSSTKETKK